MDQMDYYSYLTLQTGMFQYLLLAENVNNYLEYERKQNSKHEINSILIILGDFNDEDHINLCIEYYLA